MEISMKTRVPSEAELAALADYNQTVLWQDLKAEGENDMREDLEEASWEMVDYSDIRVVDGSKLPGVGDNDYSLIFVEWGLCESQLEIFTMDQEGKLSIITRYCPADNPKQEGALLNDVTHHPEPTLCNRVRQEATKPKGVQYERQRQPENAGPHR